MHSRSNKILKNLKKLLDLKSELNKIEVKIIKQNKIKHSRDKSINDSAMF